MLAASFFEIAAGDVIQAVIILVAGVICFQKLRDKVKELEAKVVHNTEAIKPMPIVKQTTSTLEEFAKECSRRQEQRHSDFEKYFREISERTARIEGKIDRMNGEK